MSGNVTKRGKSSWRVKIELPRDPLTGKRRVLVVTVRGTKKQAEAKRAELLNDASKRRLVEPSKTTMSGWIETWLALRSDKVNARTIERYAQLLRLHVAPTLGHRPLQQIESTDLDALYSALGKRLSPRTVHHIHVVLGACLGAAVRKKKLPSNPVADADAPATGDEDAAQVLEQEQLGALLASLRSSALYPIVATAAFTGARRNEILALRWSDVDFIAKTLRIERALEETEAHGLRYKVPKTERGTRTITIDDGLLELLRAERERHQRLAAGIPDGAEVDLSLVKLPEGALVFPSPVEPFDLTRPRHPRGLTKEFCRRARKLGFGKLRFHDLRATHETLLLDAGVPVHVVAARCGQDPAVMLRVYAKRTKKADNSAAAIIGALSKGVLGG
jgi:integrase